MTEYKCDPIKKNNPRYVRWYFELGAAENLFER